MTGSHVSRALAALFLACIVTVGVARTGRAAAGQPPPDLQHIRALYEGASYEDAMRALDAADGASIVSGEQHQTLLQYRALCLLALDRQPDAEKAIEEILSTDPLHQPGPEEPPRLVAVFDRVRSRMLPSLARQQYAAAKDLFDHHQFDEAASGFERVLELGSRIAPGDREGAGDLATLAGGFLELSRARAAEAAAERAAAVTHVFTSVDRDVVPPVPIQQEVPPWRPLVPRSLAGDPDNERQGGLDVLIGPTGDVQDAVITRSIDRMYDAALVRAAKRWKYQPATKNGVGVNYRRSVIVRLVPSD
jgi:TonB family protein